MISLNSITKTYVMGLSGRSASAKTEAVAVHALRGVSLTIEPGEFVAIMGPAGKHHRNT